MRAVRLVHGRVGLVDVLLCTETLSIFAGSPRAPSCSATSTNGWTQRVEVIGAGEATAGHNEIAVGDVAAILLDDASGGVGVHGRLPGDRGGFDLAVLGGARPSWRRRRHRSAPAGSRGVHCPG